jgi:hypothetical protein
MAPGQILSCGHQYNSLFSSLATSFYIQVSNGNVPPLHFFENVIANPSFPSDRMGQVVQSMLPLLKNLQMLNREVVWEIARQQECPDSPSRWKCMFLCETLDDVKRLLTDYHKPGKIFEVEATGLAFVADSLWLPADVDHLLVQLGLAQAYWQGKRKKDGLSEVLFSGDLKIIAQCDRD